MTQISSKDISMELMQITNTTNEHYALTKLKLIPMIPANPEISVLSEKWERLGAETYIAKFSIKNNQHFCTYVIKACVKSAIGLSISSIIDDWIEKRSMLAHAGINTPTLYGFGNGCIVEEYIPFNFINTFAENKEQQDEFLTQLATMVNSLSQLNFCPINIVPNLMSRGSDIVWVDFGEDLGYPNSASSNLTQLVIDELKYRLPSFSQQQEELLSSKTLRR